MERAGKIARRAYRNDTFYPRHQQYSGVGIHDTGGVEFGEKYGSSEVELLHLVQFRLGVPLSVSPYPTST